MNRDKIEGKWNDVFRIECSVNFHPPPHLTPSDNFSWHGKDVVMFLSYEQSCDGCFVKQME
jgi:hypothetical protein